MTHEELLAKIDAKTKGDWNIITDDLELPDMELINALRAVVKLCKPTKSDEVYESTWKEVIIQAIEKELK
jgi:hypothetical protein